MLFFGPITRIEPKLVLSAIVTVFVALGALSIGPAALSMSDLWNALIGADSGSDGASLVLWSLRMPRVVLALLVGATLALAGATLQALYRNPLADPALLGISSGAAMLVALGIVVVPSLSTRLGQPILAFAGGMGAMALVARLGTRGGKTDVGVMLLAGIAVNALAAAVIGCAFVFANDPELRSVIFWTLGSFAQAGQKHLLWSAPLLLFGAGALMLGHRALDALSLGEADAHHLGFDVERAKRRILLACALSVGAGVASVGVIGFVGLVVPHMVRLWIGPAHRALLPLSAILGGALLVVADSAARAIVPPLEIPVGIFTALMGAPFFLLLLARRSAW
ncbi:MAG: iron ABC transporter permease [Myxococcota bacterium]